MNPTLLLARLASLKEAEIEKSLPPYSEDTSSFPISAFLELLIKSKPECSTNYNEGAKLLYNWLTNEGEAPLYFGEVGLKEYSDLSLFNVYGSYDIQQWAKIVIGSPEFPTKLTDKPFPSSEYSYAHEALTVAYIRLAATAARKRGIVI